VFYSGGGGGQNSTPLLHSGGGNQDHRWKGFVEFKSTLTGKATIEFLGRTIEIDFGHMIGELLEHLLTHMFLHNAEHFLGIPGIGQLQLIAKGMLPSVDLLKLMLVSIHVEGELQLYVRTKDYVYDDNGNLKEIKDWSPWKKIGEPQELNVKEIAPRTDGIPLWVNNPVDAIGLWDKLWDKLDNWAKNIMNQKGIKDAMNDYLKDYHYGGWEND
jgi:hypothetical protein